MRNRRRDVSADQNVDPYRLTAAEKPHDRYPSFVQDRTLAVRRQPLLARDMAIFTMGSCFAEEVRRALTAAGIRCLPDYRRIVFDPALAKVDELPDREHLNFYNTFTVRQQLEQSVGAWTQAEDDHWTVGRLSPAVVPWREQPSYQDPYRRFVFARTPEMLRSLVDQVVSETARALEAADAFVFTFGMTEVFVNRRSGRVVCQKPAYGGGGGQAETDRLDSTFEQNLGNVRAIIELVRARKPQAPIILSVSPVPLARTFGPEDVVIASQEGKAILRAVLGQVVREYEDVAYLPSYEYVSTLGPDAAFREDLRHVRPHVVDEIVGAFLAAFMR